MGIEKIVAESGLFDDIFYIKTYRDVRLSSLTPLEHYCRHGVAEDRKPNADFDPVWYREYYVDVKEAGVYPFLHFLESGRAENRFQNEAEEKASKKIYDTNSINQKIENIQQKMVFLEKNNIVLPNVNYELLKFYVKCFFYPLISKFEDTICNFDISNGNNDLEKLAQLVQDIKNLQQNTIAFPLNELAKFDEKKYLKSNVDVKIAIEKGQIESGIQHFILYGHQEIRQNRRLNTLDIETDTLKEHFPLDLYYPTNIVITNEGLLEVPCFDNPLVSIIIPAYNQANYTYACVASIINHTSDVSYEIIIMDDKSPSADARNLDHKIKNITFITNEENLGFLRNCNKGAEFAKGKYILFLNNDTNVQQYWLSSLVSLIESDETIGMVGSKLVYPDSRQQEAGGIVWNDASAWNFGRLDDPTKPEYNYVKEVDYISGAAIMIRKSLWNEIGGFDERYIPAYYEDTDLAFEVRKHGYKVMFQPRSVVVHFEGVSNGTDVGSGIKKYQVVNNQKFFEKWKDVLEKEHFPNAQDVFLARDRSKTKPRLLFIDHYLPHYDQDAGSKATLHYLDLFIKNGMVVKFIGDNFWHYPDTPYLDALTQRGIEVLYGGWYANNWESWIKENGKYFDYIVLSRPHISVKYIDLLKQYTEAKILYFAVDLHYLREKREFDLKQDIKYLESSQKWKEIEFDLMKKSDCTFFYSDVEVSEVYKEDASIQSKQIPLYIYSDFSENTYEPKSRKDIMFIGGFAHGPNIDAVQWFVNDIWPIIKKRIPDIIFYIIGANPPKEIQDLASSDIIVTGFISDEKLKQFYGECKLVVAPLRYGAGVKGKIVDSLYHAMPVITTHIGAEGIFDAENIMKIADESLTFANEVIEVYSDNVTALHYSHKAFENSQKYFSSQYAKTAILDEAIYLLK